MKRVICENCGRILGERDYNKFVSSVQTRRGTRRMEAPLSAVTPVTVTCDRCGTVAEVIRQKVPDGDKMELGEYLAMMKREFPDYPCAACDMAETCEGRCCDRWRDWYRAQWRTETERLSVYKGDAV